MDDINLSSLSGAFASTSDASKGGNEPPDAEYDAVIEKCWLRLSSTNKPMVSWQFRIEGGEQAGRCLFRHDVLQSDDPAKLADKVKQLRTDFHRCGVVLENENELKTKPAALVGKRVAVRKRTKNGFVDVFINGLLDDPIPAGGSAAPF